MVKAKKKKEVADPRDITALFRLHNINRSRIKDIRTVVCFGVILIFIAIILTHNLTYSNPSLNATLSRWGYEEVCNEWVTVENYTMIDKRDISCNSFCGLTIDCYAEYCTYNSDTKETFCTSNCNMIYLKGQDCYADCMVYDNFFVYYYNETVCTQTILVKR